VFPPLSGARRRFFWCLLLLAVAVRVAFALEVTLRDTSLEAHPYLDMWLYDQGARRLLAGDLALAGLTEDYGRWLDWLGRERFHRLYGERPLVNAPLYYYWVAGGRLLGGGSPWPARWLQIGLTLATALLTMSLAWQTTRRTTLSLVAFGLVAFQPTALLYSAFLLRVTLLTFLLAALLVALARYERQPTGSLAAGLGALLGLLHLLKAIVPLLAPLVLWALLRRGPHRARRVGLAAVGFLILVSPLVVRSQLHGTALLHNSSTVHTSLVRGNHPGNDGLHLVRPDSAYLGAVIDRGGSGLGCLLETIRSHPTPWSWLGLEARKLLGFVGAYEPWNNVDPSLYRGYLLTLRPLPVSMAVLLPLAFLGLVAGRSRSWIVLACLMVILATCLVAVPLTRNRLPALPCLAILAALGAERLAQALRVWRTRPALGLGLGLLLACSVALSRPWAVEVPPRHAACATLVVRYRELGAPTRARDLALEALAEHPARGLEPERYRAQATQAEQLALIRLYALASQVCLEAGDREGARRTLLELERLYPGSRFVDEQLKALE
jgi:4-amino-4-deoxy-L-arabinose transferase-like glycosyltransferase